MINKGIIQSIYKDEITIKFYKDSACAHCSSCGGDKKFGNTIMINSDSAHKYKPGDEISIEINDALLLKLSLITYIFPAIFMILGYFFLNFFGASENASIFGSFLFLIISFIFIFFYDKKRVKKFGSDFSIIE